MKKNGPMIIYSFHQSFIWFFTFFYSPMSNESLSKAVPLADEKLTQSIIEVCTQAVSFKQVKKGANEGILPNDLTL